MRRLMLLPVLLLACKAPGKGPRAEAAFRRAAPVTEALERYRTDHHTYPESLGVLVPNYLDSSVVPLFPSRQVLPLAYRGDATSYELRFSYVGPGMNDCVWSSATRAWSCAGRY